MDSKEIPEEKIAKKQSAEELHGQGTESFQALLRQVESIEEIDRKLEVVIAFMNGAISQSGSPHFRDFWDAKRLCIELFKEHMNPAIRVHLWALYSELCNEARKLKEIFDEQSAFAVEQIELALQAIESDMQEFQSNRENLLKKSPNIDFFDESRYLKKHYNEYNILQQELNFLNVYAAKIHSLRKELVKTDMRIRNKNKFFHRLSSIGDIVFPRRKELIQQVSERFTKDIDVFIQKTFSHETKMFELFEMREEIKALQEIAKLLTLNTEVFSQTRLQLSKCWDSIKQHIEERKKVNHDHKVLSKHNQELFHKEIEQLQQDLALEQIDIHEGERRINDVVFRMKQAQFGKVEMRKLREDLQLLRQVIANKKDKNRDEEKLVEERQEKALSTHLQEILALDDNDSSKRDQLQALFEEMQKEKKRLKEQIESHRRKRAGASFGFSEALQYTDLIDEEKTRLDRIDQMIAEIEEFV